MVGAAGAEVDTPARAAVPRAVSALAGGTKDVGTPHRFARPFFHSSAGLVSRAVVTSLARPSRKLAAKSTRRLNWVGKCRSTDFCTCLGLWVGG